ncbi:MAG: hypothetical protein LKK07_10760 [Lactococcus lactis]|jgi:hypothetical protein|nr:hypothetical protein [Lactococcus lactis]MCI2139289.1 hypothetical protein [Lactococcus lactis]MCI2190395.1 hypothetical protein [Lactococcus lactis]
MKMNKKNEEIMFEDLKKNFPDYNYNTEIENREDEIFGEFIKFFYFFYTYKIYSSKYKKCTFNEYLKDKNQDIN